MDADTSQVPGCFPARGPVLPPRTPSTRCLLSGTGDSGGGAGAASGPSRDPGRKPVWAAGPRPAWFAALAAVRPQPLTMKTPGSGLPWGGLALLVRVAPAVTDPRAGLSVPTPGTRLRTGAPGRWWHVAPEPVCSV